MLGCFPKFYFVKLLVCRQSRDYIFLKSIAGSPVKRHHRPGIILYLNDPYDVLRSNKLLRYSIKLEFFREISDPKEILILCNT